jgi:hypothetical protein
MQLALPVSPKDVKKRYRELAKKYHPDLNRDDLGAEARMKKIGAAAEALTGVDLSTLSGDEGAGFFKETGRFQVGIDGTEFTVSMGMQAGELQAADWIYAAALGYKGSGAYLAGYSGRVIEVDSAGDAIRAYDIGVVPKRIIDTGDYLYILTDTRLYILRGELLCGVIDTFDGGELIVGQTGFGLLEKKRFRWFHEEGTYLGSIVTKNPIRRVYYSRDGSWSKRASAARSSGVYQHGGNDGRLASTLHAPCLPCPAARIVAQNSLPQVCVPTLGRRCIFFSVKLI